MQTQKWGAENWGCLTAFVIFICVLITMCTGGTSSNRSLSKSDQEMLKRMSPDTKDFIWGQTHKKSDGSPDYGHWNK